MSPLRLGVCITLFTLASCRRMPWDDPFKKFSAPEEFSYRQFPPPPADDAPRRHGSHDEFSFKPFDPDVLKTDPSWSEVDIIKLHYDCAGRLIREEAVKLKTRTGVPKVPEGEWYKMVLSGHPEIAEPGSENPRNDYSESGNSGSVTELEAPVTPMNFRSMRERFKIPKTTRRPVAVEETTPRPEVVFLPDQIIDVPKLPCPDGQNEDPLGNCRPMYGNQLFQ